MIVEMCVYDKLTDDFSSTGLCGALVPTSCKCEQVDNGLYQITLTHPYDKWDKWKALKIGNVITAPVPTIITPPISMDSPDHPARVTTVQNWVVKTGATVADRKLYKKATGSATKASKPLPFGSVVTVIKLGTNRHQCKTSKGTGWVAVNGIEYGSTITLADTNAGIEAAQPAVKMMDQPFRIREVEYDLDKVQVKALHRFYDLSDNVSSFSSANCSAGAAITGVLGGCKVPVTDAFAGYTDTADTRSVIQYTQVSPVKALLDPDVGIAGRWGLKLVRDDDEFYLLRTAGANRGVVIEYGNNMLSMTVNYNDQEVVTRVIPMGKTKKGAALYLSPTEYVDSPLIGNYPLPRMAIIDYSSTCTERSGFSVAQCRAEMARLAALEFSENHIDQPKLSVNVKYVAVGDSRQFSRYLGIDRIYLYDTVTIIHKQLGIALLAEVIRIVWDVLTGRVLEIDVSNARAGTLSRKIPNWQLAPNIPGNLLAMRTVGMGALGDDVGNELDLTNNESVGAVAQQFVRNAWITGEQVFKYAAGAPNPTPSSIIVSANLQNVLMDRWQYKNASGAWVDYPTGDGNATNTATALVIKPEHAVWVSNICTLRLLTTDPTISDTYNLYKVSDGATGPQGVPGPAGADGAPTYTWIKYADTPTSGMSESPTNKVYMGIAYNKPTATESSAYSDYAWSLIKGTQGIQGPAGADGAPTYTWIKYASSAVGANMSDDPTGKTYIGLAYNKSTAIESTTASDYTWALIQGPQGLHGLSAILGNAAHTLPKTTDGVITYAGSGTTLRLFEGAQELSYDGMGLANGTYKVTPSATGITCGSLTDSGTYLTVGNHSNMTGNTASVTYAITGKRADGSAISLSIVQTLSVAQQGETGANAVVFGVYALNGSTFTNQIGSLPLSAAGYDGANQITSGATYTWKKYQAGSWVTISGQTGSTLTVSGADVVGLQAYRCDMLYGGVTYTATITLTDKTDSFQSGIQSTGGNSFRNGIGKTTLACRIWQNAQEIDALKSAAISEIAPSSPVTGAFWYKITPTTPQVALMRWSGSAWVDVTTNPTYAHIKAYTWYRRDKDGNALDGGAAWATGKVVYADGDDVDNSTTFSCEVE